MQRSRSWNSQSRTRRCVAGKVRGVVGGGAGGEWPGAGLGAEGGTPRRGGRGAAGGLGGVWGEAGGGPMAAQPQQALGGEEAVGEHDHREVAVQAIPAAALVVVEATLALGVLV